MVVALYFPDVRLPESGVALAIVSAAARFLLRGQRSRRYQYTD
jgi:hypothetical protein